MRRWAIVVAAWCVPFAGCNQYVVVEPSFARTDAGFINSGLDNVASLFLWDIGSNKIVRVSDLNLPTKHLTVEGSGTRYIATNLRATRIKIAAGALLPEDIVRIETAISQKTKLELVDYTIERYPDPVTSFVNKVNSASDVEKEVLRIQEAAVPASQFRYILVDRGIRGEKVSLSIDNDARTGATFPVSLASGQINIEISGSGLQKFEGGNIPAIINFRVLKVSKYTRAEGVFYRFSDDTNYSMQSLIEALRNS
jgi:hypothetical protein